MELSEYGNWIRESLDKSFNVHIKSGKLFYPHQESEGELGAFQRAYTWFGNLFVDFENGPDKGWGEGRAADIKISIDEETRYTFLRYLDGYVKNWDPEKEPWKTHYPEVIDPGKYQAAIKIRDKFEEVLFPLFFQNGARLLKS